MSKQKAGFIRRTRIKSRLLVPATSARQSLRVNVPFLRDCTHGKRQPSVRKSMNTRFDRALLILPDGQNDGKKLENDDESYREYNYSFSDSYLPTHIPISIGFCIEFRKLSYRAVDLSICIAPVKKEGDSNNDDDRMANCGK